MGPDYPETGKHPICFGRSVHYWVSCAINNGGGFFVACEQALLFGRVKRVSRERASERRSREGPAKGELATIPYKFSFVLRPDEEKHHWLKNDVPEIKVD